MRVMAGLDPAIDVFGTLMQAKERGNANKRQMAQMNANGSGTQGASAAIINRMAR